MFSDFTKQEIMRECLFFLIYAIDLIACCKYGEKVYLVPVMRVYDNAAFSDPCIMQK
jgi:hypothetical protein